MSLDQDWPTVELRDILAQYGFRILGRERRRTGPAPWRRGPSTAGGSIYDPEATWTETHYTIRRYIVCEACGHQFGYNFEVDQISRVHKAGRSTSGALRRELGQQIRRRIRCPRCRAMQREPRRRLRRAGQKQTVLGCGLILGGLLLVIGLGLLGGWLAGIIGFFIGLFLGLLGIIVSWFLAFPYLLSNGPSI